MTSHLDNVMHELIPAVEALRADAVDTEREYAEQIARVHPHYRDSARNLAHYLALRRTDLRDIQQELAALGVSSLGRTEAHVLSTLDAVCNVLHVLTGQGECTALHTPTSIDARSGPAVLDAHAVQLLGSSSAERPTRIMVTMGTDAAEDPHVIHRLVAAGMDIMRINTAHDGPDQWLSMIHHMRQAELDTQRRCLVHVDLAGPKFRVVAQERIRVDRGNMIRLEKGHPVLSCEPVEIFDEVRVGDPLWFDDGKIGGVVRTVDLNAFIVEITHVKHGGAWLRAERGINLPSTPLDLPALTEHDIEHLGTIGAHADIIGMSFVRTAQDVTLLHDQLHAHSLDHKGVVVKIETRDGFENLPSILFEGLRHPPFGVMVARGDLAVELGYERLAEVQEEIMWLCEAAHVPVIWATQVLEGMAKKGIPTRAEVSDAAMSVRAECVMLNKGPYIEDTVRLLIDVLKRMSTHHHKKRSLLRRLHVSEVLRRRGIDHASVQHDTHPDRSSDPGAVEFTR
jgi:pyruvate kinase